MNLAVCIKFNNTYCELPCSSAGVYILEIPPSLGGGGISADVIWGKNMKCRREKGGKCKRKKKKGERK
jgi:hypothetical protein